MHILVTRPEADAASLKMPLEAMGHRVSLAPMAAISFANCDPVDTAGCSALIATSRNAIRGLERQAARLPEDIWKRPLFAVGSGTAKLAREAGFANVIEGPATAADLVPVITGRTKPGDGALVHLAGDRQAFDLKAALQPLGFDLRQPVVYRMLKAQSLPPAVVDDLGHRRIDAVILMSPETARTFTGLLTAAGLTQAAQSLHFLCLSGAVAGSLGSPAPQKVAVAARPGLAAILALVREFTK